MGTKRIKLLLSFLILVCCASLLVSEVRLNDTTASLAAQDFSRAALAESVFHSPAINWFYDLLIAQTLNNDVNSVPTQEEGSEIRLTPDCREDFTEFVEQVSRLMVPEYRRDPPDEWVLQMASAWELVGNETPNPTARQMCIKIKANCPHSDDSDCHIQGKYCTVELASGNHGQSFFASVVPLASAANDSHDSPVPRDTSGIRVCLPASCTTRDVHILITLSMSPGAEGLERPVVPAIACSEKPGPPSVSLPAVMTAILATIALTCVIGTVVEAVGPQKSFHNRALQALLAFSLYRNTKKLVSTATPQDSLACLDGMRVITMAWVVLVHLLDWHQEPKILSWIFMPTLNATMIVDTFFLISGTVLSYNLLKQLDKSGGKMNYPHLVLHRYLRLTPVLMLGIGASTALRVYIAAGNRKMYAWSKACREQWWYHVFYIQNLIPNGWMCFSHDWYLGTEMQCFLVAPFIVYALWHWPRLGQSLLAVFSALSIVSTTVTLGIADVAPTRIRGLSHTDWIYNMPWTRCGPYIIGLGLGYWFHQRRGGGDRAAVQNIKLSSLVVVGGWIASVALMLFIIYGPFPYWKPENSEMANHSWHSRLYGGTHRYLWGLAVAWIAFACVTGNGSFVNDFLSWKAFVPLGRLTYGSYIAHREVMELYHFIGAEKGVANSGYYRVYEFIGNVVMSTFMGFILALAVELPGSQLERMAFGSCKAATNKDKQADQKTP